MPERLPDVAEEGWQCRGWQLSGQLAGRNLALRDLGVADLVKRELPLCDLVKGELPLWRWLPMRGIHLGGQGGEAGGEAGGEMGRHPKWLEPRPGRDDALLDIEEALPRIGQHSLHNARRREPRAQARGLARGKRGEQGHRGTGGCRG